jgi:hypothetical protein
MVNNKRLFRKDGLSMDCKKAFSLIHEYLDDDLSIQSAHELEIHLQNCPACKLHYQDLKRTELFMRSITVKPMSQLTKQRILNAIPIRQNRAHWITRFRNYLGISAAVLFFILLTSTLFMMRNQNQEFMIRSNELDKVMIQGNKVLVPKGKVIDGNIMLEHGDIEIEGEVNGNITVIDGKIQLASTAHISGHIEEIDGIMHWVKYKIMRFFNEVSI